MGITVKQQMMHVLEKLPDEAFEEMMLFVSYLNYKYVLKTPAISAYHSDDVDPWEEFMQLIKQVQQGPWATEQTANAVLASMRR